MIFTARLGYAAAGSGWARGRRDGRRGQSERDHGKCRKFR
jgi:hypothetical protein